MSQERSVKDLFGLHRNKLVEPMGFEPTTSSMPSRRAPNCATAPPKELPSLSQRAEKSPAQRLIESLHQRQPLFAQVQLVFDLSQDFIIDPPFVAQLYGCPPFGAQQLARELHVTRIDRGIRANLFINGSGQLRKAMLVTLFEILMDAAKLVSILLPRFLEVRQCRFDHRFSRLFFLGFVALRSRKPQRANQRRQRQSLHDQGHQDHAKRKKHDQVALWKWAPVRQRLRQCNGGCQCYYTAHPRPTHHEDLPRRRHRHVL